MWKGFKGKVVRFIKVYLFPQATQKKLSQREGSCIRCGKCCKIIFKCPFFDESTSPSHCLIYKHRSKVCKLFPLNEKDIEDVNHLCGFSFQSDKEEIPILQPSETYPSSDSINTIPG